MATLTLAALKIAAKEYIARMDGSPIPELFGVTDGKAVGTYVEQNFTLYLQERFSFKPGNSASGIDFPDLNVDLKVTSIKQPQSSCPYRDSSQKVYGLGYHLLVFVYEKADDSAQKVSTLKFHRAILVDEGRTGDYPTTTGLQKILDNDGIVDDIAAFLEERNLQLDEVGRLALAERILLERPATGYLTVSNALQWRLQFGRVVKLTGGDEIIDGIYDLLA